MKSYLLTVGLIVLSSLSPLASEAKEASPQGGTLHKLSLPIDENGGPARNRRRQSIRLAENDTASNANGAKRSGQFPEERLLEEPLLLESTPLFVDTLQS